MKKSLRTCIHIVNAKLLVITILLFAYAQQGSTEQRASLTNIQLAADGQSDSLYSEGQHYFKVGEPARNADGKVEVMEIFWYGCPHCFSTEPYIESWVKSKPADTEFNKIAAPLSGIWEFHAQVYYTNKSLGIADDVHKATFNAIHQQNQRLSSLSEVTSFYKKQIGMDPEEYKKAFNSFSVSVELKKASSLLEQYQINSVPTFVVGGAYRITAKSAGSVPNIFNVIDHLVKTKFQDQS